MDAMSFMLDFGESQPYVKIYSHGAHLTGIDSSRTKLALDEFPFRQGSQQGKLGQARVQGRRDLHSHKPLVSSQMLLLMDLLACVLGDVCCPLEKVVWDLACFPKP